MDKKNFKPNTSGSPSSTISKPNNPSSATTTVVSRNVIEPRPVRRMFQNSLVIWVDADFDASKDNYKKSMEHLQHVAATVAVFTDRDESIDFLTDTENEKVSMIVSGTLGQHIIPVIQECPQLVSIYIFCVNQLIHERWAKTIAKVKGVYTEIDSICEALRIDRENCDRALISISFNGLDPLFMYTQFLKEALLDIEDDDTKSIKELAEYCRLQDDPSPKTIEMIEREYRNHSPIWWYTGPYFIYSMLNCGLRKMDVDIILKMGFFIRHLHNHITQLHREQQGSMPTKFQVFRGQGLSIEDFEKMKKTKGGLMSFNNFLSTSRNRTVSLDNFARPATKNPTSVGILFVMAIDTAICIKSSTPFAEVSKVGYYKNEEEEILFSTHTIFRIDRIERIEDKHTDRLWQVNLTLAGNQDVDFNKLTAHIREEVNLKAPTRGVPQLAFILLKLGEPAKAKKLYNILLPKASSDIDRADYNHKLGWAYDDMGEYSKALSSYERSLEIRKIALPPNHPDLASSYNNIGVVYKEMGEYSKALSSYERSLEIRKIALPPNHPDLASSYLNIGSVYNNMGKYSKALSSYERSLEIRKIALPPNHPDLAGSYLNIGSVYYNMGEYSKALSSYERSLEIKKIALPPNHPDLAYSYNGIGLVYNNMGEYSKALSYYEKVQEIWKKSLPSTHPHIAHVKRNIEDVKKKM
ncbi:unnamed protein product [Rotaria sp. Silwood2]|nr:unnamed protein product [Rotaria sp. Silwood2]